MLQFVQSSPSTGNINMDMTVLERQKANLYRLYNHQRQTQDNDHVNLHSLINVDHEQSLLSHCSWKPVNPDRQSLPYPGINSPSSLQTNHQHSLSAVSNSNNSSTTPQCNSSLANRQVNISSSAKKRKAEFDIEEEGKDEAEETGEERSEITTKADRETSTNNSSKVSEVQKPDYIHVRARRGQATDSHSLAERARREKISKKMKFLQDLVPGCNKVTGKAGMLDEIINYVQSLQKQVEFISMKLATLNPRLDFSMDNFFTKEIPAYIASSPAVAMQLEATNVTCFPYNSMHQGTSSYGVNIPIDQSQMLPQKLGTSSAQIPEAFLPQLQLSGWDPDLRSLFNAGLH